MQTFHSFTHEGTHYKLVYDELFDPSDLDAETLASLDSGEYVVLGCLVSEPCAGVLPADGQALHCECCQNNGKTVEVDSLWGIVIEPDIAKVEAFVKETM